MKLQNTILAIAMIVFIFSSCSDESELTPYQDCIDHFLEEFNMQPYDGEEIACLQNYLVFYVKEETSFALLLNDCADLVPQLLVDCEGNELCRTDEEGCSDMILEFKELGVIGI